ncbi:MAG TPA: ABC transporter substrate-binding protein [Firmicutes bacterium]|nr:ABC transporter substrate-binding protein [Candidatus Fermentithermobacillaceae bacterium]
MELRPRVKSFTSKFIAISCITALLAVFIAGCKPRGLKVGATAAPHAEILEIVKPILKKEGIDLQIVEYDDYVKPNIDLADKQIDANYFQHVPYLEDFAASRKLDLVWVAKIHIEPMGIYSSKIKSLSDLAEGGKVGIPNDATNGGRALALLEKAGLIKLKEGVGIKATVKDIVDNPKKLDIVELAAPMLPRTLPDLDIAVINGNFALQAGLSPTKDALFLESGDSPFANVLVVRKGDEKRADIQKLAKALQSPEVKKFIEEKYKGAVIPAF